MAQDAIGAIPRQRYFDNQLLFAADFQREQSYGTAFRKLQTRLLFTPGVLAGMGVSDGAPGQARVAPGAAVDASGNVVLLVDQATLNGVAVPLRGGSFVLDLSPAPYHGSSWLLTVQFAETQDPGNPNQVVQVPAFVLHPLPAAPGPDQVPLAEITVVAPSPTPPPPEETTPPSPPTVTVDTSVRTEVTLSPSRLPALDASSIGSGTFAPGRIPPLDASVITTGTLSLDRIPDIPASKVTGGGAGGPEVWARELTVYPSGGGIGSQAIAHSGGFFVGLLRTDTNQGRTYFALGIGFAAPLLSFQSPEMAAAGVRVGVYPDRTRYSLAREGGQPGETATALRFEGVDPALAFDLLTPESALPAEQRGMVMSLVAVGTRAADAAASPPVGAAAVVRGIRDAISPFSFAAVSSPDTNIAPDVQTAARALRARGWIAPDAAALLAALQPGGFAADAEGLLTLLSTVFPDSTATVAQAAWALAAASVPVAAASPAVSRAFSERLTPPELTAALVAALLGAYPPPSVQQLIVQQQLAGTTAQAAAPLLRAANAQFGTQPLPLGVLLRLAFAATASTPLEVAQALRASGYTAQAEVTAAVQQLFPATPADAVADAVQQAYAA